MALERLAHPRPGPVQEHPLIRHRDGQEITDLVRVEAVDVPERDDRPLRFGQYGDRGLDGGPRLEALRKPFAVIFRPDPGRVLPRPGLVEPIRIDGWLLLVPLA